MSEEDEIVRVRIEEWSDRYMLIDVETGDDVCEDGAGFTYWHAAKEFAERNGYEIEN
jgi:hypothetical protein